MTIIGRVTDDHALVCALHRCY